MFNLNIKVKLYLTQCLALMLFSALPQFECCARAFVSSCLPCPFIFTHGSHQFVNTVHICKELFFPHIHVVSLITPPTYFVIK